ncbi:MAG TPA: nuclear transport factor 2 family protein [Caulobacteraceae bacterium]|jgi:ketosteroid isomerase-like protein
MTTQDTANALVAMWKAGEYDESGEKYWAEDVCSVEPMGDNPEIHGKDAARAKGEWWNKTHEIHSAEVEGPYVNGDQFVVRFKFDVTVRDGGQRMTLDEMAVYTVKAGKIAEERFFYGQ